MRSTMPVALAWLTSSASASWLIGSAPSAPRIISTFRWTRLSAPPGQRRMKQQRLAGRVGEQLVEQLSLDLLSVLLHSPKIIYSP